MANHPSSAFGFSGSRTERRPNWSPSSSHSLNHSPSSPAKAPPSSASCSASCRRTIRRFPRGSTCRRLKPPGTAPDSPNSPQHPRSQTWAMGSCSSCLPPLATQLTSDPTVIGGLLLAMRLPWLICSLFAGAVTYRVDRRQLMWRVPTLCAAGAELVRGRSRHSLRDMTLLYALAIVLGIGETFRYNAAKSSSPHSCATPDSSGPTANRLARNRHEPIHRPTARRSARRHRHRLSVRLRRHNIRRRRDPRRCHPRHVPSTDHPSATIGPRRHT